MLSGAILVALLASCAHANPYRGVYPFLLTISDGQKEQVFDAPVEMAFDDAWYFERWMNVAGPLFDTKLSFAIWEADPQHVAGRVSIKLPREETNPGGVSYGSFYFDQPTGDVGEVLQLDNRRIQLTLNSDWLFTSPATTTTARLTSSGPVMLERFFIPEPSTMWLLLVAAALGFNLFAAKVLRWTSGGRVDKI